MKPAIPVVPGMNLPVTEIAKDQKDYLTLPAFVGDDYVLSRWRLSWRDRVRVVFGGSLYLWIHTGGNPLQPLHPTFDKPSASKGE